MANKRDELIEIIKKGQGVLVTVGGRKKIITMNNLHELPNEADLAIGNPDQEKAAMESLDAQIKNLEEAKKKLADRQKAEANVAKEAAKAEAKAEADAKAEAKAEEPKATAKAEDKKEAKKEDK